MSKKITFKNIVTKDYIRNLSLLMMLETLEAHKWF